MGSSVDAVNATYDNTLGSPHLSAQWRDPHFDAGQEAFYYIRVLEIPTPRWSAFDAVQLQRESMAPVSIQERASSSAIWYQP